MNNLSTESDLILDGEVGIFRRINLEDARLDGCEKLIPFTSDLSSLGFFLVGDMICSAFSAILIRSYLNLTGDIYAHVMCAMREGKLQIAGFELTSDFSDEASLTTTTTVIRNDLSAKGIYRRTHQWKGVYDLHDKHRMGLFELRGKHGDPRRVDNGLRKLAESIDYFYARRVN